MTDEASSKRSEDLEKITKEQKEKWEQEDKERENMWKERTQKREENWEKRVNDVEERWEKYIEEEENKWDKVRDGLNESKYEKNAELELKSKEYARLQDSYKAARTEIKDKTNCLTEKESTISNLKSEIARLNELLSGSDLSTTVHKLNKDNRESVAFQKHIDKQHGRMGKTKQQTENYQKITMKENQIVILKEEIRILRNGIVESKALHLKGTKYGIKLGAR